MSTTTKTPVAALFAAAAIFLTGCTAGTDVFSGPSHDEKAPVATPAPTIVPGDTNADGHFSIVEQEAWVKFDYELIDGSIVRALQKGEPVSEEIIENIRALTAPAFVDADTKGINLSYQMALMEKEEKRIDRTIIMVDRGFDGSCDCSAWGAWTLNGWAITPTRSKEIALTAANEKASTSDSYVVIVVD